MKTGLGRSVAVGMTQASVRVKKVAARWEAIVLILNRAVAWRTLGGWPHTHNGAAEVCE